MIDITEHFINFFLAIIVSLSCTAICHELIGIREGISIIFIFLFFACWIIFTFMLKKKECCCVAKKQNQKG
jgi:hypothetical protein